MPQPLLLKSLFTLSLAGLLVSPLQAQQITPRLLPLSQSRGMKPGGFFLYLEGQKMGFPGESTRRPGWSEGSRFTYQVVSPRDPQSGLPTGQRQHSPVTLQKAVGSDSPRYFSTITTNMNLRRVVLEWMETVPGAGDRVSYRITLTNANIASYRQFTEEGRLMEELTLTFQKIEQTHVPTGTGGIDDWEARN